MLLPLMDNWSRVISAGVGPIIVISACGLLCLAFYNRLAAVVTRLRGFHRERLHEQDALNKARASGAAEESAVVLHQEVLGMLEVQIVSVMRRAHLIRRTLGCLLGTIICLALCSLCLGLSIFVAPLIYLAAVLFIVGLLMLVVAVMFALLEMRRSLDPVELESRFVRTFIQDMEQQG